MGWNWAGAGMHVASEYLAGHFPHMMGSEGNKEEAKYQARILWDIYQQRLQAARKQREEEAARRKKARCDAGDKSACST